MLGGDHRGKFRQNQPADGEQVFLPLEHAAELGEVGFQPVLLGVFVGGVLEVADHLVDVVFECRHLAAGLHRDEPCQIALRHSRRDFGDGAHLAGQVGGQLVHVVGEIFPGTGGTGHAGLAAEAAFDTHLAGHRGHLVGEGGEGVDHAVDRFGKGRNFALGFHGEFLAEVAVGDGRHDAGDAADLTGKVAGHVVDVVGQILPGARHALHIGLTTELAFGAHLAGHAGHFRRERPQLIHHDVDGVLQLENLPLHVDGDLLRQVTVGHGSRHFGDVPHLVGEVAGHVVHVVGEILPGAGDAFHVGLTTQLSFRTHFAGHAGHFRRE